MILYDILYYIILYYIISYYIILYHIILHYIILYYIILYYNIIYYIISIYTGVLWKILFSIWIFFNQHSRFTAPQRKKTISLTPSTSNHFHLFHRYLGVSRAITEESSPLQIASSWTRTGNLLVSKRKLLTTKLEIRKFGLNIYTIYIIYIIYIWNYCNSYFINLAAFC